MAMRAGPRSTIRCTAWPCSNTRAGRSIRPRRTLAGSCRSVSPSYGACSKLGSSEPEAANGCPVPRGAETTSQEVLSGPSNGAYCKDSKADRLRSQPLSQELERSIYRERILRYRGILSALFRSRLSAPGTDRAGPRSQKQEETSLGGVGNGPRALESHINCSPSCSPSLAQVIGRSRCILQLGSRRMSELIKLA
jgi:hypothetical protein